MHHLGYKSLLRLWLLIAVGTATGCVNGPFYRLYYGKDWAADEQYGPTFYTRLEELKEIRGRAGRMSEEEQTRVAQQLLASLREDPSPPYRREVVRTLGTLSAPVAAEGLRSAAKDSSEDVRIAACRAWGQRGGPEALQVLGEVVGSDSDRDVRVAAIRELGEFKDQAAVRSLGVALDDTDPALQHRAVESLRSVTGKDFGDSVAAWRQFVRGDQIQPTEEPWLARKLRHLF